MALIYIDSICRNLLQLLRMLINSIDNNHRRQRYDLPPEYSLVFARYPH